MQIVEEEGGVYASFVVNNILAILSDKPGDTYSKLFILSAFEHKFHFKMATKTKAHDNLPEGYLALYLDWVEWQGGIDDGYVYQLRFWLLRVDQGEFNEHEGMEMGVDHIQYDTNIMGYIDKWKVEETIELRMLTQMQLLRTVGNAKHIKLKLCVERFTKENKPQLKFLSK